ncbi:MAG: ABC transporter permease [Bacteroides sp.]|nr:ABC transporter permease [Eubacterium sp.]MCM1418124.1 ABC transporter permease [Roseburia sp.]MCM1462252.1 ABC transporter permease [Bacteroides sp.]
MRNIKAIFLKQVLDTLKNKIVLIQFLMLPVMAVIMENTVQFEDMPERFFVNLFAVMFVGMAPLTCMSAIIAEEKEKNTLLALMMSNVKPRQYLLAVGAYIFIMCMGGTAVFAALGGYLGDALAMFLFAMIVGIVLSEVVGAAIGIFAGGQMAATSLTLPIMMVISFVPMLSMFNETIKKFAGIVYSQQISDLIVGIGVSEVSSKSVIVILANFAVGLALFALAYRKKGLE